MDAGKDIICLEIYDSSDDEMNGKEPEPEPSPGPGPGAETVVQPDEPAPDKQDQEVEQGVEKITKGLKALSKITTKFMENFDPELSNREKRKLTRKLYSEKKNNALYDDKGILISADKDFCDCLDENCPGCHFPCPKCRSCKCGPDCRVHRKWMYELIENEAAKTSIKNTYIK